MSLSAREIALVMDELSPAITGGLICRVYQPDATTFVLEIRARRQNRQLLISAHPEHSRLHFLSTKPPALPRPPAFCELLKSRLENATLQTIEQLGGDRVVSIHTERAADGARARLVCELTGRGSNLVCLDSGGSVVQALHERQGKRTISRGQPYPPLPPSAPGDAAQRDRFTAAQAESYSAAIEAFYSEREEQLRFKQRRQQMLSPQHTARKQALRKLEKLEAYLAKAEHAESYRLLGELLKANLHAIPPGQSAARLTDYSKEPPEEIEIALEPSMSPLENMQALFKRYKKFHTGLKETQARLEVTRRRLAEAEASITRIEAALTLEDLDAVGCRVPVREKPESGVRSRPRQYVSADGLEILVGRSNEQNDELTLRVANGNDLWLHVQSQAGSHVIGIIGAKNEHLLFFEDEMRSACSELVVTTDDGSRGAKGFVTERLMEVVERLGADTIGEVFAVGPTVMMRAVAEVTRPLAIKTTVSLNPIMVDGTGMCGGCRVEVGGETKFACVDGPDFDAHLVDFTLLMARQRVYHEHESQAAEKCRLEGLADGE